MQMPLLACAVIDADAASPSRTSDAVIDILNADDVVFPEIGARLDLDQIERNLSGILQAMHASQGNEDRLVLAQQDFLVVAGDDRGAVHHDPVFGAVIMFLQRQLGAGIDGNALDLEPVA